MSACGGKRCAGDAHFVQYDYLSACLRWDVLSCVLQFSRANAAQFFKKYTTALKSGVFWVVDAMKPRNYMHIHEHIHIWTSIHAHPYLHIHPWAHPFILYWACLVYWKWNALEKQTPASGHLQTLQRSNGAQKCIWIQSNCVFDRGHNVYLTPKGFEPKGSSSDSMYRAHVSTRTQYYALFLSRLCNVWVTCE